MFDEYEIVPNEKKIKKISFELISNTKILLNKVTNNQDFVKFIDGLDKGRDLTASNTVE